MTLLQFKVKIFTLNAFDAKYMLYVTLHTTASTYRASDNVNVMVKEFRSCLSVNCISGQFYENKTMLKLLLFWLKTEGNL